MSALLVRRAHLDAFVQLALVGPRDARHWYALSWYAAPTNAATTITQAQALCRKAKPDIIQKIGRMLLEAKRASIAAAYGADAPELAQTSARYRVSRAQLHVPASP
jgi:hypothetical protein